MGKRLMGKFEKPVILQEGTFTLKDLDNLKKTRRIWKILDIYKSQLAELFEIKNPRHIGNKNLLLKFVNENLSSNPHLKGSWVYFPWSGVLLHMINKGDYYSLRTNRNRDIITLKEQKRLKDFTVGIAGLSIGSNIAFSLSHLGIRNFRISDFDYLSTSNLNRVSFSVSDLTKKKIILTARKLFEIDPFSNIYMCDQLKKTNIELFLTSNSTSNVVIDAMDDFKMKILLRVHAKKHEIPVLMFTNLGDSCLVDIERYDIDSNVQIFNGLLGNIPKEILESKISKKDENKFAAKLVGIENISTRALASLNEIGNTIVGRPQISSTVIVSSGFATYLVKQLALKQKISSGRQLINFDSAIFLKNRIMKMYSKEPRRNKIISKLTT